MSRPRRWLKNGSHCQTAAGLMHYPLGPDCLLCRSASVYCQNSDQGMTASEVTILSRAGRIEEIMRMTSGTQQTESARENAKELLAMAEKEKQHFGN